MKSIDSLHENLERLKLDYMREHCCEAATKAARNGIFTLRFFRRIDWRSTRSP